ncbi:hypothetical protein [Gulosibacter hominis]|uniref:hypothetical protein n=1 Tax=Gulosibacter hominis TaxID=2770504 RepID=UPI001917AC12|nr:hypothetical protein [Gulosibacter hominis]
MLIFVSWPHPRTELCFLAAKVAAETHKSRQIPRFAAKKQKSGNKTLIAGNKNPQQLLGLGQAAGQDRLGAGAGS